MGDALSEGNLDFFYDPENGIDLPEIGSHMTCQEVNSVHDMLHDDVLREQLFGSLFPDGSKPDCEYMSEFEQWLHSRYDNATVEVHNII